MASDGPKSGGSGKGGGTTDFSGKRGSAKDSVKPNFNPFKKDDKDGNKKGGNSLASQLLKNENPGSINGPDGEDENAPQENLFTGIGRVAADSIKGKGKFGSPSLNITDYVRGKGPIGLIIALILGFGGLMGGSQSIMPLAIEEMIVEKLNSVGISSTMASDAWLNTQLNQGIKLTNTTTGDQANLFAFSENQVNAMEKQGLKVCQGVGSQFTSMSVILYKYKGQWIPVIGSDMAQYPASDIVGAVSAACGVSPVGSPQTVSEAMGNGKFKNAYTAASKTWRGGVSGWFDKTMSNITETKLSINRNRWTKYVTKSVQGLTESLEEFNKTARANLSRVSDSGVDSTEEFYLDGNGNKVSQPRSSSSQKQEGDITTVKYDSTDATADEIAKVKEVDGVDDLGTGTKDVTGNKIDVNNPTVEGISKVLNSKAVKVAAGVSEAACAVLEGMMTIYTTVAAFQQLQFLNLISGYLEAVDKVKAGEGNSSPVGVYANNLVTEADTRDSMSENNEVTAQKRTAMMSVGMGWLFGVANEGKDDVSVMNVNFDNLMSKINKFTGRIQITASIYEHCGYVKAGVAAIDLASTIISIIPVIGQGIKAVQLSIKAIAKVAIKVTVQIAFYAMIPIAVKHITKMLINDAATEWFGEDLGNALASGASKYLGGNATSGGMSPGSKAKVTAFLNKKEEIIAEEAKYQRSIRSPFDITSPYTFLGSIVYSAIPFAYSTNSIASGVRNMSSLVSKSAVAMLPTASAWGINDEFAATGNCSLMESVGAVGDLFCNPYVVTDTDTMYTSPLAVNDIVYNMRNGVDAIATIGTMTLGGRVNESDNFDANGKIKANSNLAKYITYCGQRTSQYGVKDATIAAQLTKSDNPVVKIIGYVPVVNNVKDIALGLSDVASMAWSNGRACVATDDDNINPNWKEYKWYQRYAENQRLLENMDPKYKAPTTAFLEEYYKENPLDQSFEGTLARFSGQTKEQVEDAIAFAEYLDYIDNYDPSNRYAFGQEIKPEGADQLRFDNDNKVAYAVLLNTIEFADVRNRSFVV